MSAANKESALSRWSRRKQDAAKAPPVDEPVAIDTAEASLSEPLSDEVVPEPAPLTDADMPDIDSLAEDSDFTGFMSPGVSDELRNLALRKLFHAPVFNIRDGLDEYDEDYTSFEKLGDIVTCDMKHQIEVQERKRLEALEQERQAEADAEFEEMTEDTSEDMPEDMTEDMTEDIPDEDDAEVEVHDDLNRPRQTQAQVPDDHPSDNPENPDARDE
jgi:hypothetical protein